MRGPLDADMIPDWQDTGQRGLERWWQEMVERHLAFHPDDAPETVISFSDGNPLFSPAACDKLRHILNAMFHEHGSLVHQVAEQRVMAWLANQEHA